MKLITIDDKLKTILNLTFLKTLKQLETYFDKTKYLRQYVTYYAQKTQALQERKTRLLKKASIKNKSRQHHSRNTAIDDSFETEIDLFNQLQFAFNRLIFLVHFDKTRTLYIDVDASKERDFEIMMYHVKTEREIIATSSKQNEVQFIMFLSKVLSFVESKY